MKHILKHFQLIFQRINFQELLIFWNPDRDLSRFDLKQVATDEDLST